VESDGRAKASRRHHPACRLRRVRPLGLVHRMGEVPGTDARTKHARIGRPDRSPVSSLYGLASCCIKLRWSRRYDAVIYSRALGNRKPGTHNLHLVEDADHNFSGRADDVVDVILDWWGACISDRLTTGIWGTGQHASTSGKSPKST
jgi:hypothetical protein